MGYERYPGNPQGNGRSDPGDFGHDYGSGRDYSYSSARDYEAAGEIGGRDRDRQGYGNRDYGNQRYGQRDQFNRQRDQGSYGGRPSGQDPRYGRPDQDQFSRGRYGADARSSSSDYHGSYGSDGRRFEDVGARRHADDDDYRGQQQQQGRGGYGRQPQGYDYEERGFLARAGDEVRSWFGDDDAERRREMDSRYDDRGYGAGERHQQHRDADYHNWRSSQIAALDRDYDEYRQHHRAKFENEFSTWRTSRQSQRDALNKVEEHMDVVGSDGEHVGTVDKVRGDRILLTKNDVDAGGRHHSFPSSWIASVEGKVTLSQTAADAKKAWKDEERNQALFGDDKTDQRFAGQDRSAATGTGSAASASSEASSDSRNLNKSFPGTY